MKAKLKAFFWALIFTLIILVYIVVNIVIKAAAIGFALIGKGRLKRYGINVWEGFDNSASADLGGDPDESVSSRLGKGRNNKSAVITFIANKVDLIAYELFGDLNHCNKSIEHDEGRNQVTTH